jgi:DNA polymerase-4
MSQALRLCPGLLVISHSRGRYSEMSQKVMERVHNISPLVEQISIDEAFVDLTDVRAQSAEIAAKLQKQILDELGLPCSVGLASNKLVAKIATETGKKRARGASYPFALTVVPGGTEAAFLAPLSVSMLWGVGPKTEKRLSDLGIHTIGQLAALGEPALARLFGENGREMARHALGQDDRPVVNERATKSISQEITFSRDVSDDKVLETTIKEMSVQVGKSLRQEHLSGTTVKLKLRWPDFTTLTRQTTLPTATDMEEVIYQAALDLLRKVREQGRSVRLIGVGVSNLGPPARQMELWGQDNEKARKLREVLDALQDKYGDQMVKKGK